MRLSESQHLFEYPILEIRRLLRAGADDLWTSKFVTATLRVQAGEAAELVDTLLEEGFIAATEDNEVPRYQLTMKGRALAMASARPIKRSTAERLVSNFLQRVEEVNSDRDLLFWIEEVLVFGSFLTEAEILGDVDLALMYRRRTDNPDEWTRLARARVAEARAYGRTFRGYFDKIYWPKREIELWLRNRSGSLSLHDLDEEREFVEALPHRRIYVRNNGPLFIDSDQVNDQTDDPILQIREVATSHK